MLSLIQYTLLAVCQYVIYNIVINAYLSSGDSIESSSFPIYVESENFQKVTPTSTQTPSPRSDLNMGISATATDLLASHHSLIRQHAIGHVLNDVLGCFLHGSAVLTALLHRVLAAGPSDDSDLLLLLLDLVALVVRVRGVDSGQLDDLHCLLLFQEDTGGHL